jgi:hypothetical protein
VVTARRARRSARAPDPGGLRPGTHPRSPDAPPGGWIARPGPRRSSSRIARQRAGGAPLPQGGDDPSATLGVATLTPQLVRPLDSAGPRLGRRIGGERSPETGLAAPLRIPQKTRRRLANGEPAQNRRSAKLSVTTPERPGRAGKCIGALRPRGLGYTDLRSARRPGTALRRPGRIGGSTWPLGDYLACGARPGFVPSVIVARMVRTVSTGRGSEIREVYDNRTCRGCQGTLVAPHLQLVYASKSSASPMSWQQSFSVA